MEDMKKKGIRVAGIGHRIKSKVRQLVSFALGSACTWQCVAQEQEHAWG